MFCTSIFREKVYRVGLHYFQAYNNYVVLIKQNLFQMDQWSPKVEFKYKHNGKLVCVDLYSYIIAYSETDVL